MAQRTILYWPDKRLATEAAPVGKVTDEVRAIWADMIDTMEAMPGWGLAAPQIGVMQRLAVVDVSETRGKVVRLADPEIVQTSLEMKKTTEASPCLKGVSALIERPVWVDVSFIDHVGIRVRQRFEDKWAVSVLHQIDHLNGKLYVDRLSRMKRDMLLKKSLKAQG
ncbi:MAG: peptide deformylase [Dinoroseobacter sp.]|jgi:peptide deformylase